MSAPLYDEKVGTLEGFSEEALSDVAHRVKVMLQVSCGFAPPMP
jgi:hypothetical protein